MTPDGSVHAEFWLAIFDPDQEKRIHLANAWLERWVKTCVLSQAVDEELARLDHAEARAHLAHSAMRQLGLEVALKACRIKEQPRQPGAWERRTDYEVTVLMAPRPLRFPILPPLEPRKWEPEDKP